MFERVRHFLRRIPRDAVLIALTVATIVGVIGRAHRPIVRGPILPVPEYHRAIKLGVGGTTAKFKVNGTASSPAGFDATNNQTITLQLEAAIAPDVYKTQFFINDPNDATSPQASLSAPQLTLSPSNGIPATPTGTVTFTMPASGAHSYSVRCVINNGVETATGRVRTDWTFERIVGIRSGTSLIRKILPAESTQYSARGWADEQNRMVDSFNGGGPPSGAASGDLTASYPSPTVSKVKGTTVITAGGALTTGQLLRLTGASTADWGPLDLANANATTGLLPAVSMALGDTFEDITSTVEGRFGSPLWKANTPSQAPTVEKNAGTLSIADASVPKNADLVNIGANAPTNGVFERIFGTPAAGTGNFEINIPMAKPVGDGTTTIYVEIKVYGGALVASGTFTLTTTYTNYNIPSFALSASTDYIVRWFCNGSGSSSQARAFVGPLQVKPLSPSAPFITVPFYRVGVTPEMFHDGAVQRPPILDSRSYTRNSHTRFLMRTTAPYVYIQAYDKLGSGASSGMGVKVNGVPQTPLVPASGGAQTDYSKITFSTTGMQLLELTTSYVQDLSLLGDARGWSLNALDAVLVPTGYFTEVVYPSAPRNRVVFYGDSIMSGYGPTNPPLNGLPQQIRRGYAGSAVFETAGSDGWFRDMKSPGAFPASDVQVANLVNRLAAHFGDGGGILYTEAGVNDWGGAASGTCSAANLQILVGQFLDAFHLRCPKVQIIVQSPTADTLQASTNSFGDNLAAYRTALQNAATAAHRTGFCTFVDGLPILSTGTDLVDSVHSNDVGVPKHAASILSTIATVQGDITTPGPNSWDVVTPGFLIANNKNAGAGYLGAWPGGGASFGALYVATDRTVANSYTILGDGANTYLNAASGAGHIYFGLANSGGAYDLEYQTNGLAIGKGAVAPVSRLDVKTKAIGEVGMISRWFSSGQTGDLFQGRKQDETVVAIISKDGNITANASGAGNGYLGSWSGGSSFGSLYLAGNPATTTAYAAISDGASTFWNTPAGGGHHYWAFANSGGNPAMNFVAAGLRIGDATSATDKLEVVGNITIDKTVSSPVISQGSTSAASGQTMSVKAQTSTFTNGDGGSLELRGGVKNGSGINGSVRMIPGTGSVAVQASSVTGTATVVGLCYPGNITSTDHPANAGDRVINLATVGSTPTVNPGANGSTLWNEGGDFAHRGPNGTVSLMSPGKGSAFAGRFLDPGIWCTAEVTTTDNSSDAFACSTDISVASNWADGTAAGNGPIFIEGFIMARDQTSNLTHASKFLKKYQYQGGTLASDGQTADVSLFLDPGAADFNTALANVSFTGTTVRIRVRGGANHTQKWAVSMKVSQYAP